MKRLISIFIISLLVVTMSYAKSSIGIVLMHGKDSFEGKMYPLSSSLESSDYTVVTPNMPWSKKRIYEKSYKDSILEISKIIHELKSDGIEKIYLAGHSMGAVVAAGYASLYDDIDGIILIAPGHFVGNVGMIKRTGKSVAKAKTMIDAGKADEKADFDDTNMGKMFTRYVEAGIFYSWFNPNGEVDFVTNMQNLKGNIPVLYIAASKDKIPRTKDRTYAYDGIPKNPKNKFVIIEATHLQAVGKSSNTIIEWLGGKSAKLSSSNFSQAQITRAGIVLNKFDSNADNQISPNEAPFKMSQNFDRLDANSDGYLSKEELYNLPPR